MEQCLRSCFVTVFYLLLLDYCDDERNIFVPNVDNVTHPSNKILANTGNLSVCTQHGSIL
jgi:hypothetical protein